MATYLDQFIESVRYLETFQPGQRLDYAAMRRGLLGFQAPRKAQTYQSLLDGVLLPLSTSFLARSPLHVAHACHSVSHAFRHNFRSLPDVGHAFELALTVGNVYYRGENIYQASRSCIRDLILRGPRNGEELPVHVWLTLEDMTILDLTILASLRHHGRYDGESDRMLVWKENEPSDFHFEPLLVDNLFATRVDDTTMVSAH
ncbi:hypothetical protein ACS7SF_23210 (plasmid) [Ralstonia sp. 25C]|uniref:hypothetical protein n=1 Tax=Ralstonia sp. 25C TaxID=3447363 RepID=UPI003F7549A9